METYGDQYGEFVFWYWDLRIKETTKMASFMRTSPDYNSQPVDEREGKHTRSPGRGEVCRWTGCILCLKQGI